MVLGRQPKKYKHFIKILTSQLMIYENITTTNAKAKHLMKSANHLIKYAKRAAAGQSSPKNLLKGRVSTDKVRKKLLLNLIPRLRNIKGGNFINVSQIFHRRRGDNAPLVKVSIVGNQKSDYQKSQRQNKINNRTLVDIKTINKKWLLEEKAHYQNVIAEKPQLENLLRQKINRIDYQIWTQNKLKKSAPRYTLLV